VLTDPRWWTSAIAEEDAPEHYLQTVIHTLRRVNASFTITVKLHPSESLDTYRAFERCFDVAEYRLVTGAIGDRLRQADLVIGTESTALLEALLVKIPIISVNMRKRPFTYPFHGNTSIRVVYSDQELEDLVRALQANPALLGDEWTSPDVLAAVGPIDGQSTERLYRLVVELPQRPARGLNR
jgi:hypothetical protein